MSDCRIVAGQAITVSGIRTNMVDFKRNYTVKQVIKNGLMLTSNRTKGEHELIGGILKSQAGRTLGRFCQPIKII